MNRWSCRDVAATTSRRAPHRVLLWCHGEPVNTLIEDEATVRLDQPQVGGHGAGAPANPVHALTLLIYFGICAALIIADGSLGPRRDLSFHALGAAMALTGLLFGIKRHQPRQRNAWLMVGVALALFASSDVMSLISLGTLFTSDPASVVVDAAGYLMLLLALRRLVRNARAWAWVDVLDASVIVAGFGLAAWALIYRPLDRIDLTVGTRATVYGAIGMVILLVVLPLLFGRRTRVPSALLLIGAFIIMPLADLLGGAARLGSNTAAEAWFIAGQQLALVLVGAAALHPSMTVLAPILVSRRDDTTSKWQGGLVALAMLIVPAIILALVISAQIDSDLYPIAIGGMLIALFVVVRILLREAHLARALAQAARLAAAVEASGDAAWMMTTSRTITYINRAFTRMYGWEAAEIVGVDTQIMAGPREEPGFWTTVLSSVADGQPWTGSLVNRRKDRALIEVAATIAAIHDDDGRLVGFVQTDRDVTRQRELENAIERDARERAALEAALARIDPEATIEQIALDACLELVGLDGIDSAMCIDLTPDAARVLAAAGRVSQVIASGTAVPEPMAAYVREHAESGPWVSDWRSHPVGGLAGLAITSTGLLTVAYAPFQGRGKIRGVISIGVHASGGEESLNRRIPALTTFASVLGRLLGPELVRRHDKDNEQGRIEAIIKGQTFEPSFQPIVELGSGAIIGHEALTRFEGGERPDLVFTAAFAVGLGLELEVATLSAALRAAEILPASTMLSLNVSPALVMSDHLGLLVADSTRPIVLELTEHVAIDDYALVLAGIARLRPSVRLAVDDAGAGYASLRHILELAPHFVKLDIGLVRDLDTDPARAALIAGMQHFASARGLSLIAEGIESSEELGTLTRLGIRYGQGYLLGRPQDWRAPGPWPSHVSIPAP